MPVFKSLLEPHYFQRFHCIASDCQDSCCAGWDVTIDQATYDAYQQCQEPQLKPLLREHVVVNSKPVGNSDYVPYALIKKNHSRCPFLSEERLCTIQKKLNEEALSITCATYPRTFNAVDGVLERSLDVSCEEAARLVLLNQDPMRFVRRESDTVVRNPRIPVLNTSEGEEKPYGHFFQIRAFIVALLQERTYPLWQRLIILSTFCSRLDQVAPEWYAEDIPQLISYFTDKIRNGDFRRPMDEVEPNLGMQLQEMNTLINHRLQGGVFVSDYFRDCLSKFRQGLSFSASASGELPVRHYAEAHRAYYQPFMEKHEYILENYLVNYVFKNLFPFGPQKNRLHAPRSIYTEFMLLALLYSMIKTLLIGLAGFHRDDFGVEPVLKLVQAFSKTIEHNIPYLDQAVQYLSTIGMSNTGGVAVLVKK